jgi:hypothetical protein
LFKEELIFKIEAYCLKLSAIPPKAVGSIALFYPLNHIGEGVSSPEVEKFIRMCLDADTAEVLRNQTLTAKRIYDRLVPELSFPDSYSIERRAIHEMRAQYLSAQQNGYPTP